jgi:hypothetical protein
MTMAFSFFSKKPKGIERTPAEVAKYLDDFLNGTGKAWDWDDFISTPLNNRELEKIRERCLGLDLEFPPDKPGAFCNEQGLAVIRGYVEQLRHATPAV